jgi:hypothetical protein
MSSVLQCHIFYTSSPCISSWFYFLRKSLYIVLRQLSSKLSSLVFGHFQALLYFFLVYFFLWAIQKISQAMIRSSVRFYIFCGRLFLILFLFSATFPILERSDIVMSYTLHNCMVSYSLFYGE